jgi:hypothetical protein
MIYTVIVFTLAALVLVWGVIDVIQQTREDK